MGNTDSLPTFTEAEDLALATRMHAAAIVLDGAKSEFLAAEKALLLINLGKLFTQHTCLQAVEFKVCIAHSGSDSHPSIEVSCEVADGTDAQAEAVTERACDKLGRDWGFGVFKAILSEGKLTREDLTRRLVELRKALDAERSAS